MFFNSLTFALFFALFFLLYWFLFNRTVKLQNLFLLFGSYVFYGWWDWRFLFLLAGSSLLNYYLGILIAGAKSEKRRNFLIWTGLLQGLGSLLFFKYFNFFIASLTAALLKFNIRLDVYTLNIILPLGISFYTFKTISYLLDIKKGKIEPSRDWVVFFGYVAFFPTVTSGPIDRPGALIPQLKKQRVFNYSQASDGMRQILLGLFKKIVIADNCAAFTTEIFSNYKTLPASSLLFGAFLFTMQIYTDFSGYSDIAIGISNLLGFKVTRNFDSPFFAQNIADFWRRWHITLTTWLTDYVFTPLSIYFRNYGKMGTILAILINFTLIGIWHGANFTFLLFGFLHGCYYIPLILRGTFGKKKKVIAGTGSKFSIGEIINVILTFLLVMFTFVIFRADTLTQAFDYYRRLFSVTIFTMPVITETVNTAVVLLAVILLFWAEWQQRGKQHILQIDFIKAFPVRALIYFGLILLILSFSATKNADFIYFKF